MVGTNPEDHIMAKNKLISDNRNPRNRNNQSLAIIGNDAIDAVTPHPVAFPRLAIQAFKRDNGKRRRWQSPQEVIDLAIEYYTLAEQTGEPVTITGLCSWLGTTRDMMIRYCQYELRDERGYTNIPDGVDSTPWCDAIKHIRHIAEAGAEIMGFQARNPAFAIFALKNYGWRDTQTVENIGTITSRADPETLAVIGQFLESLRPRRLPDTGPGQVIDVVPTELSTELSTIGNESYQPVLAVRQEPG